MFHSVGLDRWDWCSVGVAEPLGLFEQTMEALKRRGYSTAFFASTPDSGARNRRELALTFDDGYLDNWVHVFPILRKHGLKATIFVSPEFVDPRDIVRPQVEPGGVTDREHAPGECCAGFLSWPELTALEKSGLVDIQSHSLTHTWYCKGPRVVDFWHPGTVIEDAIKRGVVSIWMLWNRFPEFKPHYLTKAKEYEPRIPYGTPIFEYGKSLETRRYFPADGLEEVLPRYVEDNGGLAFFEKASWRQELQGLVDRHRQAHGGPVPPGHSESEADYVARVRGELSESKRILDAKLDKRVDAVCWPGGGVTDQVLAIAREVGYRYFTLPSKWADSRAVGGYSDLTPRMGGGRLIRYKNGDLGCRSTREFAWCLERIRGSRLHWWLGGCVVAARLLYSRVMGG